MKELQDDNETLRETIKRLDEENKSAHKYRLKIEKVLREATHALSLTLSVRFVTHSIFTLQLFHVLSKLFIEKRSNCKGGIHN